MQFGAMLYYHDNEGMIDAARVANDMREERELLSPNQRDRLWTYVYYSGLIESDRRVAFMAALNKPDDVATFRWLFPEDSIREDRRLQWRFFWLRWNKRRAITLRPAGVTNHCGLT
jgi:hypothetical protein